MVSCKICTFTRHAIMQMFERNISVKSVKKVVNKGEVIQSYSDDKPYPSFSILGFINKRPIHVVLSNENKSEECMIVTAYEPSEKVWNINFKTRIQK